MTEDDKLYRRFERSYKKSFKGKEAKRSTEPVNKFLNAEVLRNRAGLTKNGRQKLTLQYGKGTVSFTLHDLNEMAKKMAATEDRFGTNSKGVLVGDLVGAALPADKKRSKDIRSATLYKVGANLLSFRVTASGQTPGAPSHYSVRVRLDDWDTAVRRGEGSNYFPAAQKATNGHISFDCTCGRHQFWYRYIATIGGFALTPEEKVYPKIRNPKLKGVCCKHVLKTIATLLSPVTQTQISKDMERQAKKTNFEFGRGKYVEATEAEKLKQASEKATIQKAYSEYKAAQAGFAEKGKSPAARAAQEKLRKNAEAKMKQVIEQKTAAEMVAKKEIARGRQLEADARKAYVMALQTIAEYGTLNEESISRTATKYNVDKEALMQIAKEEKLI